MMHGPYFKWKPGQPIMQEGGKWDAEVAEEIVYDNDDTETVSDQDTGSDKGFIEDEEMVYSDDQGIIVTEEDDATSSDEDEIEDLIETSDEEVIDEQHYDNSEYYNSINSEQENEGDTTIEDEASILDDDLQGDRSETENEEDVTQDAGEAGQPRFHGGSRQWD